MSTICQPQELSIDDQQSKVIPQSGGSRTSLIRDSIRAVLRRSALRRQQKIARDAFSTMLSLDDKLLADIGLTRGDVTWAANLPLSEDAATVLRECTLKGSR